MLSQTPLPTPEWLPAVLTAVFHLQEKKNRVRLSIRAKLLFKEKAGESSSGFFSTKRSWTDTSEVQAASSAVLDVITRCHSRRKEAITNRGEKPVKKHWLSSHKTNKSLSLGNAPGFAGRAFPQPLSVLWDEKPQQLRSSVVAPCQRCAPVSPAF